MVLILVELIVVHHNKRMVQKVNGSPSLKRVFLEAALDEVFQLLRDTLDVV
jgi:hypothetical protein